MWWVDLETANAQLQQFLDLSFGVGGEAGMHPAVGKKAVRCRRGVAGREDVSYNFV